MRQENQNLARSRVRRWVTHLWREWTIESWRPIAPAFAKPTPAKWSDNQITAAWLGHATVLINFFGVKIITDPVLFPRIGIRIPFLFTTWTETSDCAGADRARTAEDRHRPFVARPLRSHRHADAASFRELDQRHHRPAHERSTSLDTLARCHRTSLGRTEIDRNTGRQDRHRRVPA